MKARTPEYQRAYRAAHLEQCREYERRYSRKRTPRDPEYWRQHRLAHPEKYRQATAKWQAKMRAFIGWLKQRPCMDCGVMFPPCAMDFDHRDGTSKAGEVAALRSLEKLQDETAKCDIVCANCHRIRTYNRRRGAK